MDKGTVCEMTRRVTVLNVERGYALVGDRDGYAYYAAVSELRPIPDAPADHTWYADLHAGNF